MIKMTELGKLVQVDVYEAWEHEAHKFTPWLCEHLDLISDAIGIPLELTGREVAVETFSADILARNTLDDSSVLIENQLARTDHSHLGQIMTYLAGLEAHTIIWIATDFRQPHLSAIRWLNEHTVAPFSFFAIKVKAVRIGESPIAPVFEVVERPNEWDEYVRGIAENGLSELGRQRLEFWTHYIKRYPEEAEHGPPGGVSSRWHVFRQYNLVLSFFVARKSVGAFIRGMHGANTTDVREIIEPNRECLEAATGSRDSNVTQGYYFQLSLAGDASDPTRRDELCGWLHQTIERYERALRECIGEQS